MTALVDWSSCSCPAVPLWVEVVAGAAATAVVDWAATGAAEAPNPKAPKVAPMAIAVAARLIEIALAAATAVFLSIVGSS